MRERPSLDDVVMCAIPAGGCRLGSYEFYPEEAPMVEVAAFRLDRTPVTNRRFAAFVAATGYRTLAERQPTARDYPDADPQLLVPGSSVFVPLAAPCGTDNPGRWRRYVPGASWRHPYGPASDLSAFENHPVVHVAYEDAATFAAWAGKRLPTEAEFEYAARSARVAASAKTCCTAPLSAAASSVRGPDGTAAAPDSNTASSWTSFDRKVLKGGSHLCAENYCRRYRPAARHPQPIDSSTSHIGFRCAASA